MAKREPYRCMVCGELLKDRQRVMRLSKGAMVSGYRWKDRILWGFAHEDCFAKAVIAPNLTLEVLKDQLDESRSEATS